MDKLEELRNVIKQWNANRLDLFAISEPNADLEFHGVMRFYFQDTGQKVATKCIRVSSTASTNNVIETLIEKFRPDIRMLTYAEYALYEIHENGEEVKLESTDKPLCVQLNWHKDDREGRFLLRRMDEKTKLSSKSSSTEDNTFKRRLSKKEKKEKKKKEKEGKLNDGKDDNKEKLAEKLYNELPENIFTRSISNPETVLRRRRNQKLEKKLQQLINEGGSEAGGTLRIFGETLNKDIPYKTLLLSTKENSQFVVKEILEKYGLEKENPKEYCLVQLIVPPNLANLDKDLDLNTIQNLSENIKEYILDDEECPLIIERLHNKNQGILTFHIRKKPENYVPRKRKTNLDSNQEEVGPYLIEVVQEANKTPRKHVLTQALTEIGCSNAPQIRGHKQVQPNHQYLHLVGGNVQPKHCTITYLDGIVTLTPNPDHEAETFVNNVRITDSFILKHGMVIRFGKFHTFNFIDPLFEKSNQLSPDLLNQMQQQLHYNNNEDQSLNYSSPIKKSPIIEHQQMINEQNILKKMEILPAILQLNEEHEDQFLNSIITNLDVNQVQFKLAPTYTLYLAVRFRASTSFRPNASVEERAVRLTEFTNKFCRMINYVIHINHSDTDRLAFWLANSSELLHFIKQDRHVSLFTVDGQDLLMESVHIAFKKLVTCLEIELENSMNNALSENEQTASTAIVKIEEFLNRAMNLLRTCRVNAALTIQMFSQIFHYINMNLFNHLVGVGQNENISSMNVNYCTENWGVIIKKRLTRILDWAKKQGLELAADCYLNTIFQASILLQSLKSHNLDNLTQLVKNQCYKLNSVQLRHILQNFERTNNQPQQYIPHQIIEQLVELAEQTSDKLALEYGKEIRLAEDADLNLAFLLPEDGYFCDTVKGVPPGLQEFILPMVVHKLCNISIETTSAGHWTIFLNGYNINNTSVNSSTNTSNNEQKTNNNMQSTATSTPTMANNWSINNSNNMSKQGFLMPQQPPLRTLSSNQLGPQMHQPGYLIQQTPQPIYGQQVQQFPNGHQLNLVQLQQSHPSFIMQQQQQQQQQQLPKPETTIIKLKKNNNGMGLSIVAARKTTQEPFGIYIKAVVPNGAADMDGRLKAGDQLLKVDGQSLIGISQEKAAELMTKTGQIVTLEVAKGSANYKGLTSFLHNNNSQQRIAMNNAQQNFNNFSQTPQQRLQTIHSANPLMPKSQTAEHLKQHSASLVNLHPYSTYPYPQANNQQQLMMQLAMQQQQQQQQQQLLQQAARPNLLQQIAQQQQQQQQLAQKRLSTSTMSNLDQTYQPTYQNIQNINLYQQRMNSSQNALYAPDPQLVQLNRPMSTIMSNRADQPDPMHLNYSMSHTNLSTNNSLRSQPAHYSSVSQLPTGNVASTTNTSSQMPSWATLPHGGYQQQLINQRNNQLAQQQQQQQYLRSQQQRAQEEKLKNLKLEQEYSNHQLNVNTPNENENILEENNQNDWQAQIKKQKSQLEEQEERLQELRLEESKLKEQLKVTEEVEENLMREARKRKEDPSQYNLNNLNYQQQQQQQQQHQQSSEDTDNSEDGITIQQQQRLESLLNRSYRTNVSSNGIVTLPETVNTNSLSTNDQHSTITTSSSNLQQQQQQQQRNVNPTFNVQSNNNSQGGSQVIQSKSALRNPARSNLVNNKDSEHVESNGTANKSNSNQPTTKKVTWNEQIMNNPIIIQNEDDLEDEEEIEEENGFNDNYDEENDFNQNLNGSDQNSNNKDKIESSSSFTLQDIDEVLGTPNELSDDFSNDNSNQPNNTPNVIGAQEIYRDPRERIKAEKMKRENVQNNTWTNQVPEQLSFKEKMKMFKMATSVE